MYCIFKLKARTTPLGFCTNKARATGTTKAYAHSYASASYGASRQPSHHESWPAVTSCAVLLLVVDGELDPDLVAKRQVKDALWRNREQHYFCAFLSCQMCDASFL
jgi:hypothetical protein